MANAQTRVARWSILPALLALAACTGSDDQANGANQGNDTDPALTSALEDQIAVDPQLSQQSNRNAVRPPETPTQAQYPASGPSVAAPQGIPASAASDGQHAQLSTAAAGDGGTACPGGTKYDYNPAWAQRLSPIFPVYPGGRVTEAAGANEGSCRVRVVAFTTADPYQRVLDWYHTQAVRAGYSSEHQLRDADHVLAGANERDGGAFYLIVTPGRNGSEVALIANNGR
jgi:hypothetical protein